MASSDVVQYDEEVALIRERPFERSLRKCWQLAIDSGKKYAAVWDADVVLAEGAIASAVEIIDACPEGVFQVQGRIMDCFSGGPRDGGLHVYRVEHLRKAMAMIPRDGLRARPEYAVVRAMMRAGHPSLFVGFTWACHDFEQYLVDCYRKAFFYYSKCADRIGLWEDYWRARSGDADFRVALIGLEDAKSSRKIAKSDVGQFDYAVILARLEREGIHEKAGIDDPIRVMESVRSYLNVMPAGSPYFKELLGHRSSASVSWVRRVKIMARELGLPRAVLVLLLSRVSRSIDKLVSRFD